MHSQGGLRYGRQLLPQEAGVLLFVFTISRLLIGPLLLGGYTPRATSAPGMESLCTAAFRQKSSKPR
jgi:hypothetical protein